MSTHVQQAESALKKAGFPEAKSRGNKIVKEGFLCWGDDRRDAVTVSHHYPLGTTPPNGMLERYAGALRGVGKEQKVCVAGTCAIMPSHVHLYFS